jgi:hypothetical protein
MNTYTVIVLMEVEASSPREAARIARDAHEDIASFEGFEVLEGGVSDEPLVEGAVVVYLDEEE